MHRSILTIAQAVSISALFLVAGQQQQRPCTAPEHRQFDFWIGTWDVVDSAGKKMGSNVIKSVFGGCALQEHWEGAGGNVGESYNVYDATRKQWHQTWVDNGGTLLLLDGGVRADTMVLEGETLGANGARSRQRITWYRVNKSPDRLRQLWQSSSDGGRTWTVAFNGFYVRQRP